MKIIKLLDSASKIFRVDNNEVIDSNGNKVKKTVINSAQNLTYVPNIGAIKELIFLTLNAKKIFNYLKQAFIKILIFQHFDLESYI